jgi:hypothetical protein
MVLARAKSSVLFGTGNRSDLRQSVSERFVETFVALPSFQQDLMSSREGNGGAEESGPEGASSRPKIVAALEKVKRRNKKDSEENPWTISYPCAYSPCNDVLVWEF